MISTWWQILLQSLYGVWGGFIAFVPKLLLAIIIFIIGWIIATWIAKAIEHLFRMLKVDTGLQKLGVDNVMHRAGSRLDSGAFIGWLIKWFIILVFLVAALDIVGLSQVNEFLRQVVLIYLPNVIVAALVLLVGSVLGDIVARAIQGGAQAAHVKASNFLGTVARWAIWIFAILIALTQLGIAAQLIQILFIGVVAMLALAGGLAFGLGGRDHASKVLNKIDDTMSR